MKNYTIDANLLQKIADYLAKHPWSEVNSFLTELQQTVTEQNRAATATSTVVERGEVNA